MKSTVTFKGILEFTSNGIAKVTARLQQAQPDSVKGCQAELVEAR